MERINSFPVFQMLNKNLYRRSYVENSLYFGCHIGLVKISHSLYASDFNHSFILLFPSIDLYSSQFTRKKIEKKQQHYFTRNFNSKITVTSSGIPKETILYAFGGSSYPLRLTKILLHSHFP